MSVFTEDFHLPSYEELTVPELQITSGPLRAASFHLGKYCDEPSKEFMLCKLESDLDPRKCINEGKEVTRCGFDFFRKVKGSCGEEFSQFWRCVDNQPTLGFKNCRKAQAIFDSCMLDKLNIEKPGPDYFNRVRLHTTTRDRPSLKPLELPDEVEEFKTPKTEPENKNYPKYGFMG